MRWDGYRWEAVAGIKHDVTDDIYEIIEEASRE